MFDRSRPGVRKNAARGFNYRSAAFANRFSAMSYGCGVVTAAVAGFLLLKSLMNARVISNASAA